MLVMVLERLFRKRLHTDRKYMGEGSMSRFMTDEEIAVEQAIMAQQPAWVNDPNPVDWVDDNHDVTPIDLLFSKNYVDKETRASRFDTCKGCDSLFKPTRTCKECGCFMALKTWLIDASCPLQKW
jgi:hypothetical protein